MNNFTFPVSFICAKALLTTAGNQVAGEALYLQKPVLAIPEPGNFEQEINAHFLKNTGAGDMLKMENISGKIIKEFLNLNELFRQNINSQKICGNKEAVRIINNRLKRTQNAPQPLLNRTEQAGAVI